MDATDARVLTLDRVFRAPRDAVWRCWTDSREVARWYAPPPTRILDAVVEPRPGGRFMTAMEHEGEILPPNDGIFLEVVPLERLTFTNTILPGWQPVVPWMPFAATVTFADHEGGTAYRVEVRHPDAETARRHDELGFAEGWGTCADQLGTLAEEMASRTMTIERVFRASPAQVFAAWTDPEVLPRWFGPEGYSCETHRMDLRVGGEWRFTMSGEGMTFPNRHRWTDLVPPNGGAGHIAFLMDGMDDRDVKVVTVTLSPEGRGTRLRQVMVFPNPDDIALARSYGAEAKGGETLRKLAAQLGE